MTATFGDFYKKIKFDFESDLCTVKFFSLFCGEIAIKSPKIVRFELDRRFNRVVETVS